jgi:hypothetical protein
LANFLDRVFPGLSIILQGTLYSKGDGASTLDGALVESLAPILKKRFTRSYGNLPVYWLFPKIGWQLFIGGWTNIQHVSVLSFILFSLYTTPNVIQIISGGLPLTDVPIP